MFGSEKAAPPPPLTVHSLPTPSSALPLLCSPLIAPIPPARSIAPPPPSIAPPLPCSPLIVPTPPVRSITQPSPSSALPLPCSPSIAPKPPPRLIAPPPPSNAPPKRSITPPPPCSPLIAPIPPTRSIAPPTRSIAPPPPPSIALPPPCSPSIAPTPPPPSSAPPPPSSALPSPSSPSIAPTPLARSIASPPPSIPPRPPSNAPLVRPITPPQPCSPSIAPTPLARSIVPPLPAIPPRPPSNAPPVQSPTPLARSIASPPPSIPPQPPSNAPLVQPVTPPLPCSPSIAPTPPARSIAPPLPTSPPRPSSNAPPMQSITPPSSITPPPSWSPSIAPTPPTRPIAPPPSSIAPPLQSIAPPPTSNAPPPTSNVSTPPSNAPPPTSNVSTPRSIAPPPPSKAPLAPSITLPPLLPPLIAPSPTAPLIVLSPPFPSLLQRLQSIPPPLIPPHTSDVWRALDVRAMVLLSLLSQIALFVLGKRRKHSVSLVNKLILWLAYQGKDLISIAALGKLSNLGVSIDALGKPSNSKLDWVNMISLHTQSNGLTGFAPNPSNIFTSLWTPLLTLNLGGPDTITAYSFQDIRLWSRHLLIFVVQCFLAFCVIIWSVVQSSLSVFSIPLYFVGICKHIESILCLKATNSLKTKQSVFENPGLQSHPLIENQESKKVLLGYILFAVMRPYVDDYKNYPLSFKERMKTYLETRNQDGLILQGLLESDESRSSNHLTHFDIAVVELGFIFDVVYTKAPLIYTWKGCILRLISFTLSIGTLFFFIFRLSFGGLRLNQIASRDVFLTMSLLVETVALDICAVLSNLSSDWAVVLRCDNCSAPKILQYVLQYFPCFLSQQKKQSTWMGQFNLLDYCWNSRMVGVYRFLQEHCIGDILENSHHIGDILEICLKLKHTKFVEVPSCLKPKELYQSRLDSFLVPSNSFEATRGKKTLVELGERDLECSIKIDFDASIIVWHLATSICYHQDFENQNNASNEAMKISKYLSDYMMYLLVMRPAMLLPDDSPSSSLDCALNELKALISEASNKDAAADSLLQDQPEISAVAAMENLSNVSAENGMENLPKYAGYLATELNRNRYKWELIKAMWIEMLLYAAHSDQYIKHVRQLGEYGREFISIIWVMGSYRVIQEVIEEACRK